MFIKKSAILGLKIIYPLSMFKDDRGTYIESFNKKRYKSFLKSDFLEDDFSLNKKNVFKGIHGDHKTWKLISCVHGKCQAIIVNCNKKSKKFGLWEKFILTPENYFQILIPPSYGNSFLVLSSFAVYHYKQTQYYKGKTKQFTYNINDPYFKINIAKKKIIISKRDKLAPFVNFK
ncbi:dTDP-4-dehydrorhamnose 3,5-epimerase family protein [Candidatus Pelagibacter sp.]|nr:dTDP-4-dehydrorhamnose 3,5-epimerase family protein [Candidatus Pelagibacter sp.]MDC1070631.1 dTDP-4-dehydrorhamnose 3,5-epimerase family protein [Candidatus Pelagibacter sp.]